MAAAAGAGVVAVGVPTGSFSPAELTRAGATLVLDSLLGFASWYAGFRDDASRESVTDGY
jgi:phosphoglycolate phosphatase-like HAD superfamily hydrolase